MLARVGTPHSSNMLRSMFRLGHANSLQSEFARKRSNWPYGQSPGWRRGWARHLPRWSHGLALQQDAPASEAAGALENLAS
jgi:hypothetical protein